MQVRTNRTLAEKCKIASSGGDKLLDFQYGGTRPEQRLFSYAQKVGFGTPVQQVSGQS